MDDVVCFPGRLSQRGWSKSWTRTREGLSEEREGTTGVVRKYRQLVRTRVEQIIMPRILPVMVSRGHCYRNCRRMAINTLVQHLCRE